MAEKRVSLLMERLKCFWKEGFKIRPTVRQKPNLSIAALQITLLPVLNFERIQRNLYNYGIMIAQQKNLVSIEIKRVL